MYVCMCVYIYIYIYTQGGTINCCPKENNTTALF